MKFSIKDVFSKCEQICRKLRELRIWPHLLKKSSMKNFVQCSACIGNLVKRLWWSFFAKIFIDWRSLAIFCRNLGFRCLTVFLQCVPLRVSYHVYFFRVSQVSSMLHEGSVGWVHSKECSFILTYTFLAFFCFSQKKLVFLSFSFLFFFYKVLNFHNRKLRIRQRNWVYGKTTDEWHMGDIRST